MEQLGSPKPRKKAIKLSPEHRKAIKDYQALLRQAKELQREHDALSVKEVSLSQIVDLLQTLVHGSASHIPAGGAAGCPGNAQQQETEDSTARTSAPQERSCLWSAVVSAVQQQEAHIKELYGDLLGCHTGTHQQQQQSLGFEVVTAMCSRDIRHKVSTMSVQQLAARLSHLTGKAAIQTLGTSRPLSADAALPAQLQDNTTEFAALIMALMLWDVDAFWQLANTNLSTLQPMTEPLPAAHWLNVFECLQLSPQQVACLSWAHDALIAARAPLLRDLKRNVQQQAAHTDSLAALLQQADLLADAGPVSSGGAPCRPAGCSAAAGATPQPPPAAAGTACAAAASSSGQASHDPRPAMLQEQGCPAATECASLEELVEEQSILLRKLLLLGLHVGIVSCCTLTQHQHAISAAASHPSIPRLDLVMSAYQQQQQQQQMEQ